jgi:hypothetical protein
MAATFYVDDDTGSLSNSPCSSPATACLTVAQAAGQADALAGANDEILVDGGDYTENGVSLGDGNSLRESEFNSADGDSQAVISSSYQGTAIVVPSGNPAGSIAGLTLVRGPAVGTAAVLRLADNATVTGNDVTGMSDATGSTGISVEAGSPAITGNSIFSTARAGGVGISVDGGSPTISQNTLDGEAAAVQVGGGSPTIARNTITGLASPNGTSTNGIGVQGATATATITANTVSSPLDPSDDTSSGISIAFGPHATLARNRVSGHDIGYLVLDAAVSFHSDLAFGNNLGLWARGSTPVDAQNVTLYDNELPGFSPSPVDLRIGSAASLTLDSSIVEAPILVEGGSTCSITFSRGPTTSGGACEQFQTSAAPGFAAPGSGDYHLSASSPLLDAGNPAAPVAPNDQDFDGQARAQDADCDGAARRDIGADERVAPDCAAPQTTITAGPADITPEKTVTFGFTSGEAGSTFECRVDAGPFAACSGPGDSHTTGALADGPHRFEVRATDQGGNTDPTPATRDFVVDTKAPDAAITSGPSGTTNSATSNFGLSSDEPGSSLQCRVDAEPFGACSGPGDSHSTSPLADGAHRFEVRAVDPAGNVDASPAARDFVVDTKAPETTLTKKPKRRVKTDKRRVKAKFAFSSDQPGSRFECKLDAEEFVACDSGRFKRKVKPGRHGFLVRAIDAAGNVDQTPASARWRVVAGG